MTRPLFRVTCEPWEHGLVLHIDGVGVTQTHGTTDLAEVERMAREYIALALDVPGDSFDIAVTGPETTAAIQDALARVERGEPTRDLGDFARYLPADAWDEAAAEIAAATDEELPAVIAAWRSTAEVYANPELHGALTRDHGQDPDPIELQPTAGQRVRWEAAAAARGQTLEEFLAAAADAAAEYGEYARAMRARKRGAPED